MNIDAIAAEIRKQLAELEAEQRKLKVKEVRLKGALHALDVPERTSAPTPEPPAPTPEPADLTRNGTPRKIAPRGTRQAQILAYLDEHGRTRARQLADDTGIGRSLVDATLSRLAKQGKVRRVPVPEPSRGARGSSAYEPIVTANGNAETPAPEPAPLRAQPVRLHVQTMTMSRRELEDRDVAYVTQEGRRNVA